MMLSKIEPNLVLGVIVAVIVFAGILYGIWASFTDWSPNQPFNKSRRRREDEVDRGR